MRLLVWTLVIGVLCAPTLYAVRLVQVRRNAGILFERAEELEKEGDLTAAANTLFRYLQFRPDDGVSRVLLAQVYDKSATTFAAKERATEHYYSALAYFEDRIDLRARLAELLFELQHTQEAEKECLRVLLGPQELSRSRIINEIKRYQDKLHSAKLLASNPEAARSLRILAEACFENAQSTLGWSPDDQLTIVTSALAADPTNIDLTLLQARIYRERLTQPAAEERARIADELITEMTKNHAQIAQANLAAYRYRLEYELPDAGAALEVALENAPQDFDVLLAAASQAESQNELDKANEYFRRAIGQSPTDARGHAGLAQLCLRRGAAKEALEVCRRGLELCGSDEITINLAKLQAQIQEEQLEAAEQTLQTVRLEQETIGPLLKLDQRNRLRNEILRLEAEHALASGKPLRAATIFRQLAVKRSGERREGDNLLVRSRRCRRLGQVYEQLQYWELAAKAYEEEAELQTEKYGALMNAGRAWQAAGRFEAAVASFNAALKSSDAQAEGWLILGRAELQRQMRSAERDWTKVEVALQQAVQARADSAAVGILKVELLKAKGNQAAALQALDELLGLHPREVLPFAVLLYQAAGRDDRSDACLEKLRSSNDATKRDVLALETELCCRRKDFERAKTLLAGRIADATGREKFNLQRQLALVELQSGSSSASGKLEALAKQYPDDPWPLDRLAELALTNRDYGRLEELDAALEKVEGNSGSLWRFYRALRLLAQLHDGQNEGLNQAIRLHNELQSLRPNWSATFHLKGRLAQQQGKVAEAAEAYKSAIEAGASSVSLFEGLITLLYANNRWLEADAFLSRLQQVGYQSPLLESFSSRVLLRHGEFDQAVGAARSGVELRPKDPIAHVWLSQTLVLASSRQDDGAVRGDMLRQAEAAIERAVAIAPDDFRTWSGLLWYGVRTGNKGMAARAIDGLQSKAKLTEPQRMLALGQAYQLIGDFGRAEKSFVQAVHLLPNDTASQERLAEFYLVYSPEKAVSAFRRLLELAPGSKVARRALATLLVTQGADAQFAEAVELLRDGGDESADRRLHALLLMQRGGKDNLAQARGLLETLVSETVNPDAADRHLLAIIAEAEGDLALARTQFERLTRDSETAANLRLMIDFLLRHERHVDAQEYLDRLIALEPKSPRTIHTQIKWMQAAGRPDAEIKGTIERSAVEMIAAAKDEPEKLAAVHRIVDWYSQFDWHREAEQTFRDFLRDHPGVRARQAFALWLLNNRRFSEAVQLALEENSPNPADAEIQLLSNVLAIAAGHGQRFAEAERRLDQYVRNHSQDGQLLFELATLKHMQGEVETAERLYQQAIQLAPRNAFARNNLAMLLLDRPGSRDNSLRLIEEALRIAGPLPELRDTYAVVLAHQGQADEACRVLKTLLSRSQRNPRFLFHLALACHAAGNHAAAIDALTSADNNNLATEALTPEEQKMLSGLRQSLAGRGGVAGEPQAHLRSK